ncbi:hypothetical protein SprV_0301176100 [Sparganum proliferum]
MDHCLRIYELRLRLRTLQETRGTQQSPDLVKGRPTTFHFIAPILRPSPLPFTLSTLYSTLLSHGKLHRHLQDEASSATLLEASRRVTSQLNVSQPTFQASPLESRWCQIRDTVQSTALAALGRAHRQHQDWFNDKDAAISNLLAEKSRRHKAYVDCPTDDNGAAFYRSRRLVQQRPRGM